MAVVEPSSAAAATATATAKNASADAGSSGSSSKAVAPSDSVANKDPAARDTPSPSGASSSSGAMTMAAVLEYLKVRGFQRAEAAFKVEMKALAAGKSQEAAQAEGILAAGPGSNRTMTLEELAAKSAPRDDSTMEELAVEALKTDRTDRIRGFGMVRNWCEGGLDLYQAELRPLLLPLFVHAYLDLIELGTESAAFSFFALHSSTLLPQQLSLLSHLRSITLPSHIASDELAQRFRSERYVLKMSQTVFGLFLGWLTDGTGPVAAAGAAEGVGGNTAEIPATRGRLAMLRIVNERCRIQVLKAKPYELTPSKLEEGTGLTGVGVSTSSSGRASEQHPSLQAGAVSVLGDVVAEYNAKSAGPQIKLGPKIPLNPRLTEEVDREVAGELRQEEEIRKAKEEASARNEGALTEDGKDERVDGDEEMKAAPATDGRRQREDSNDGGKRSRSRRASSVKSKEGTPAETPGPGPSGSKGTTSVVPTAASTLPGRSVDSDLLQPSLSDLPPQPPLFRTVDIMREVAKLRDARKSLKIDLRPLSKGNNFAADSGDQSVTDAMRRAALPSICAYTYHDVEDGLACSAFSEDLSLMAAGFEESYVQVWSLKGQPLRSLTGDVPLPAVRDAASLNEQRRSEDDLPTRKLIGHSAPVYSLSFDGVGGSASSPRTLLSSSGDSTVRLWSMDTYSALVAYRGHQGPVWDVEYGPGGIYFATAGADKTARLWSTERIHPLRLYVGHLSDVDCLSFHPNSLFLATGSSDRTCRLWDVQRGACVRLFVGHSSPVSALKISPDGRYLASAGSGSPSHFTGGTSASSALGSDQEATISIWDLGSGKRVKKMWGHTDRVHSLDFSDDGALLISAAQDCTVRCWDVTSAGGPRSSSTTSTSSLAPTGLTGGIDMVGGKTDPTEEAQATSSSSDCVATFKTKKTPMIDVKLTKRNLCVVAGGYSG